MRKDWDEVKVSIMKRLLREKFDTEHPRLREKLLETGNLKLVENSPRDWFWGYWKGWKGS